MAFFDVVARKNLSVPSASTIGMGQLAAYNSSPFIEVMRQTAASGSYGQFMLDEFAQKQRDARCQDGQPTALMGLNVFYVPTGSAASAQPPYGRAAAWVCAGPPLTWKLYATKPDSGRSLLTDAPQVSRCDRRLENRQKAR
jgi:hypothetical protein